MCTFLTHLTAKLVLAEGGDEVRANERRQGAMRMHGDNDTFSRLPDDWRRVPAVFVGSGWATLQVGL